MGKHENSEYGKKFRLEILYVMMKLPVQKSFFFFLLFLGNGARFQRKAAFHCFCSRVKNNWWPRIL